MDVFNAHPRKYFVLGFALLPTWGIVGFFYMLWSFLGRSRSCTEAFVTLFMWGVGVTSLISSALLLVGIYLVRRQTCGTLIFSTLVIGGILAVVGHGGSTYAGPFSILFSRFIAECTP